MSDPLRVGIVVEGPTDEIVIVAALKAILQGRSFVPTLLQPEGSRAFGSRGTGWSGVYRWCRQSASRGAGKLSDDKLLFLEYDLLVLHLDADVAGENYGNGGITP